MSPSKPATSHAVRSRSLKRAGLLSIGALMLVGASIAATQSSSQSTDSVAWYTDEQAERGQRTFLTSCAACHGADWAASRLHDFSNADTFFAFVSASMPYDGDLLPEGQYIDIIAFLMSVLGLPSGDTELPNDREVLAEMVPREALLQMAQAETGPGEVGAWFTADQADAGERAFAPNCGGCHGAPDITDLFVTYTTVWDFYAFISASMPADNPAGLAPNDYVRITAYFMRESGFPAGDEALTADRTLLEGIVPAAAHEALPPATPTEASAAEAGAWYTTAQAEAGSQAFLANCAGCHGAPDMLELFAGYTTVWDYYAFISATMPADNPAGLAPSAYVSITAYLMSENGFPAGDEALTADRELLTQIVPIAP